MTKKKIERLTKEQEDSIPAYREKWLKLGESTERSKAADMIEAVNGLYDAIGQKRVPVMVMESPFACIIAANLFRNGLGKNIRLNQALIKLTHEIATPDNSFGSQISKDLIDSLENFEVGNNEIRETRANVKEFFDKVLNDPENSFENSFFPRLFNMAADLSANGRVVAEINQAFRTDISKIEAGENNSGEIWAKCKSYGDIYKILNQVPIKIYLAARSAIENLIGRSSYGEIGRVVSQAICEKIATTKFKHEDAMEWGNHNIGWIAYASFFETIGYEYPPELAKKLAALRHYHKTCGWLYTFEGMAFVSNRPTVLKRDDEGRLHCEDGPALAYADGYSFCSWHGTRLPSEWVENRKTIDPQIILQAKNTEQRAAGIQLIGMKRVLDALPHKVIDSDSDPQHGDLLEVTLNGLPEPELYLRFYCPRNGLMIEGINKRRIKKRTVFSAQAWKAGIPDHLYQYPKTRS